MLDERHIVAALITSRSAFDRLRGRLDANDFSEQGRMVVKTISGFYSADPDARSVDSEVLRSVARRQLLNTKHADAVIAYIDELPAPCSPDNIAREYRALRRHNVGMELAGLLAQGQHGDNADSLVEKYRELCADADAEQSPRPTVDELHDTVSTKGRIRIHPASLNKKLRGGLSRGEHAVIIGRPNLGKTLLVINIAGQCLLDGRRVLMGVNEEPREKYAARILARVSGVPVSDIEDSKEATARAMEKAGDAWKRLALIDLTTGKLAEVEGLVRSMRPDVVIVDQLRNLKIPGAGNRVLELDEAARELRQIARRHNVVMISVTQAGDSADEKLVLSMGDADWSNTGIQGACDLMLGIGANAAYRAGNRRKLSPCKNKVGHDETPFDVFVEPDLSLVLSKPRGAK